jgi:hypothetical protein
MKTTKTLLIGVLFSLIFASLVSCGPDEPIQPEPEKTLTELITGTWVDSEYTFTFTAYGIYKVFYTDTGYQCGGGSMILFNETAEVAFIDGYLYLYGIRRVKMFRNGPTLTMTITEGSQTGRVFITKKQ